MIAVLLASSLMPQAVSAINLRRPDPMKNVVDVSEKFAALTSDWKAYRKRVMFSSKTSDYVAGDAYKQLVALGRPAVPLIIERYREEDHWVWGYLLQDITQVKLMDRPNAGPGETWHDGARDRWLEWHAKHTG